MSANQKIILTILNFYAYAPADPCKMATSEDADGASFSIDHQM